MIQHTRRDRRDRERVSALRAVSPFDHFPLRALTPLAPHIDRLYLPRGRVLAHQGWTVREVIVILAGDVTALRRDDEVERLGPGTSIGAAELVSGATHPAKIVAGDNLEVLVINGPAFRAAARTLSGRLVLALTCRG